MLACICCSGGALLDATKTACRIAKGKETTGAMEWCKRCPSKLMFLVDHTMGDIVAGCPCTQAQAARKLFTALNNRVSRHTFLLIASQHSCAWQNLKSNHPAIHPGSASCNMIPVMLRKSLLQDTALVLVAIYFPLGKSCRQKTHSKAAM